MNTTAQKTTPEVKKTGAAADPKPKAPPKEKKPPKPKRFPDDATIHFGVDKEGKKYSPEHSPKRAGTAAHSIWLLYKEGMKVADFMKAGGGADALKWDSDRNFISIKQPA